MKKISALIQLVRPVNFVITFIVIAVSYIISADEFSLFILLCASFSGSLTASSGNIVNDIFDIESDRLNHPERPLANNKITYNQAKFLWFIVTLLSFILSSMLSLVSFLLVLLIHVFLILYSYKIKSMILTGNILIASLTGFSFFYGALPTGNFKKVLIPAIFAFIINFIREIVKDMQDIPGDRLAGIITFPMKYGVLTVKKLIYFFIIFLLILTLYTFFSEYYNIEFFIIMMVTVNPLMFYIIKLLNYQDVRPGRISSILKMNMVIGLTAIYFGS